MSPAAYTSFLSVYRNAFVLIPCVYLSTNYGTKSNAGFTPVATINISVGTYLSLRTTETGLPPFEFILPMLADVITVTPFFYACFCSNLPMSLPTTPYNGALD